MLCEFQFKKERQEESWDRHPQELGVTKKEKTTNF